MPGKIKFVIFLPI